MCFLCVAANVAGTKSIIIWSLILICVLIVGLAVAMQVKKKVTEKESASTASGGFTLSDLREMAKQGTLSPEEFEKAKLKILEAAKRVADRRKPGNEQDLPRI